MRRREFLGACAGAAVAGSAVAPPAVATKSGNDPAQSPQGPPFSLSVMLWTVYPKAPFEQRIDKVVEAGFNSLEMVEEYKNWTKDDYARFRAKRHELKLTVDATSGITRSMVDPAERDALLKEIREKLPVLEELESNKLILLTGDKVPGLSHEQMHNNVVESLKRAAEICAAKKVSILLENIDPEENPKYFLTSVTEGFQIVREAKAPNVKFLYDFFHDQIAEGNLLAKLDKNLDIISHVHIADVPGRHDPGTGEINFPNIFRKLGQLGFNGYVAMEFVPEGDTVEALRTAREMAIKYGSVERSKSAQAVAGGIHAAA
jgi:hydroxypyruvate isomerase